MDCGSNLGEGETNNLYDTVTQKAQVPTTFQPLVNQTKSSSPVETKEG